MEEHHWSSLVHEATLRHIATVYVGDFTDVLSEHWSAEMNKKTNQFCAYRSFIHRLVTTAKGSGESPEGV